MRPLVYIETTVPSFYHETRTEPDMVARREWTRAWWQHALASYEMVISLPVLEELQRGSHPKRDAILELVSDLPLLPTPDRTSTIVDAYIQHHLMPGDLAGDAMHLALASLHACRFLVTWNCRHLANANKFEHIRHVNTLLGLYVPTLTTPFELLEGDSTDEE